MSQAHLAKILLLINSYSLMQKKRKENLWAAYCTPRKGNKETEIGTPSVDKCSLSPEAHLRLFSRVFSPWSPAVVLPPLDMLQMPFSHPAMYRCLLWIPPASSFSKWWAALDLRLPFCLAPHGCVQHLLSPLWSCCGEPGCLSPRSPCPSRALSACHLIPVLLGSRFATGFAPPC